MRWRLSRLTIWSSGPHCQRTQPSASSFVGRPGRTLLRKSGYSPSASRRRPGQKIFALAHCLVTFAPLMERSLDSALERVNRVRYKSLRCFLPLRDAVSAENCYTGRARRSRNLVTLGCFSAAILIRQADLMVSTDTWGGVRQVTSMNTGTRFSRFLSNRSFLLSRHPVERRRSVH